MNILLIGPNLEENLSLGYLAASLEKQGHTGILCEFNDLSSNDHIIEQALSVDMIGLSLVFQNRARDFFTIAHELKKHYPTKPIIAGGHYASCAADDILHNNPALDIIAIHEAEHTIVELADYFANPTGSLDAIQGIVYKKKDDIIHTSLRHMHEDLDSLPMPIRDKKVYFHAGVPTAYLIGSRGCINQCHYCCITTLHNMVAGKKHRQRSVANIVTEMAELYNNRGIRHFVFHDDNFLVSSESKNLTRLEEFETEFNKNDMTNIGLTIKCCPTDVTRKVFKKLKKLGLVRVFLGIETSNNSILTALNRKQSMSDSAKALKICKILDISVQYNLMILNPEADYTTINNDIKFLRTHIDYPLNFCKTEIFTGTPLEQRMIKEKRTFGDYLGKGYYMKNPQLDMLAHIVAKVFYERCWSKGSVMQLTTSLDHLAALLKHHLGTKNTKQLIRRIKKFRHIVNNDTITLLQKAVQFTHHNSVSDKQTVHDFILDLQTSESASRKSFIATINQLHHATHSLAFQTMGITIDPKTETPLYNYHKPHAGLAAAVMLALTITACSVTTDEPAVSEYAPGPLVDTDGDGLFDQYEESTFNTDPYNSDSDNDGINDGDELYKNTGLTNKQYQDRYLTSEDSDSDGLLNIFETDIFNTDPYNSDSDKDGINDGDELYNDSGLTNKQYQDRYLKKQ